jgi:hypothetical protein
MCTCHCVANALSHGLAAVAEGVRLPLCDRDQCAGASVTTTSSMSRSIRSDVEAVAFAQ